MKYSYAMLNTQTIGYNSDNTKNKSKVFPKYSIVKVVHDDGNFAIVKMHHHNNFRVLSECLNYYIHKSSYANSFKHRNMQGASRAIFY